ncbi:MULTISPECIES: alpha/beta fold hydrolase [unclassified Pseudonocardia]|uniref:alpha/beta fold hydrolase n=1 Tax=unclassified Pseudonocardia TaxID=2619320 RepID=UPI0001FFE3C4|nr:alpha/beta fold hydrolase [Pseudonocardia sp. Ae707_Ps1]OLM20361.1 Beta-ketoadipate enol-lactone hydrolase [Pseudonocardia sp. Ae707_Ps1]
MTIATLNGIRLSYTDHGGDGPPVVLVMGTGSPGRVWDVHQVPALRNAGLRPVTLDNRGIPPTDECAAGFTVDDMAADVAALVEHLGAGPAAVVGTSLGSRVVLELALARPDLVSRVAALAAHARLTPVQQAWTAGTVAAADAGVTLPAELWAAVQATHNLSPATLDDERAARDWLDIIGFGGSTVSPGHRAQLQVSLDLGDRTAAYRGIAVPALVLAFADDRAIPPRLSREVAAAVPGARYAEIPDAGHYGYLEQPAATNRALLDFLA